MALSKQIVQVPLQRLDGKTNPKNAPIGTLDRVVNQFREKTGELLKRTGRTALSSSAGNPSGTNLRSCQQLASYKGALVSLSDTEFAPTGPALFAYADKEARWIGTAGTGAPLKSYQHGPIVSERNAVAAEDIVAKRPDMAVDLTTGIAITAWEYQDAAGVNYVVEAIYDTQTKRVISSTTLSGYVYPRCETVGGYLLLAMYNPGTGVIAVRQWSAAGIPSGGTTVNVLTVAVDRMDTAIIGTKLTIASYTGGNVSLVEVNPATLTTTTGSFAATADLDLAILQDLGGNWNVTAKRYVATITSANYLRVHMVSNDLTTVTTYTIDTNADVIANTYCRNLVGYTFNTVAGDFVVLTETGGVASTSKPYNTRIRVGGRMTGTIWTASEWTRSVGIRSKVFVAGGVYYFVAAYGFSPTNSLQPTYFLMQAPTTLMPDWTLSGGEGGAAIASFLDANRKAPLVKNLPRQGAGSGNLGGNAEHDHDKTTGAYVTTNSSVVAGHVTQGPDFKWMCAVPRITFAIGINDSNLGANIRMGIDAIGYQFDLPNVVSAIRTGGPCESADTLLVPNGNLLAFDGRQYSELNFPLAPERALIADSATAGQLTAADSIRYAFVYRYVDEQGRIHRSAPSPLYLTAFVVGGGKTSTTAAIPTLRIHGRQTMVTGAKADIQIEVYRTATTGVIYHMIGTIANDDTVDTVSFADTVYTAIETDSFGYTERLYTDGGILGSNGVSPPQLRNVVEFRGHLIGVSADYPNQLWVSKPLTAGLGPHFPPELVIAVPDDWGDFTAQAVMDDKWVGFKRNALYVIAADGPNDLGQGQYPFPQRFATGEGTMFPKSVGVAPDGIWYQSTRGLKRIGRSLASEFVGAELEDYGLAYDGATSIVNIHSAVLIEPQDQIRFYSVLGTDGSQATGYCFVWDYVFQQWFVWDGQSQISACKFGTSVNGVTVAQAATKGVVAVDSASVYIDDTSYGTGEYAQLTRTTWIPTTGAIEGFGRLYQINLEATRKVAGSILRVALEYDGNTGYVSTGSIQCVAKASFVNGESVSLTVCDGSGLLTTYVFTFDTTGGGVPVGTTQVNISGATTAADVAAILLTAINSQLSTYIGVADHGAGLLALTTRPESGINGIPPYFFGLTNNTITETVANAGFVVTGFLGGVMYETFSVTADPSGRYFVCPRNQTCSSFRISIQDAVSDAAPLGDSFNLDSISLLVGVKKNLARLPAAQKLA